MRARRRRGTSLVETVIAAGLLATVGLASSLALQFGSQRQSMSLFRQTVISQLQSEITTMRGQALAGTLATNQDVTTTYALSNNRTMTIRRQTSTSGEASNVINVTLTANWTDTAARSTVIQTAFHNVSRPRVIGVKFGTSAAAAPATSAFYGYLPSPNWNRLTTATAATNTLRDSTGTLTTLVIGCTISTTVNFTNNVVTTGTDLTGENFKWLYQGGIWAATPPKTFSVTLSSIPYAKYDVYFYVQVPDVGTGYSGTVELSGGLKYTVNLPSSSTDAARKQFVSGQNMVVYSGLTAASATFKFNSGTAAPPLHGFQLIERK